MSVFLLGMVCTAGGQTIFVDANATGDANGANWSDAYKYLQDALAVAGSGSEIWVAAGTYKPDQGGGKTPGDRTASFQLINGVPLYGGFAGGETTLGERDWQANETILSGDLNGDDVGFTNNGENSYHVVTGSGTNATAVLDGFTITACNANGGIWPNNVGGGMFNASGSPTLTNCTFRGNSAMYYGGGMTNYRSSPTVTNCTFRGNSAGIDGGGMYNFYNSSPTVTNCTFSGNSANTNGGGMHNYYYSSPTVTNCTFSGNSANTNGGGMHTYSYSSPTVTNCILWGNTAPSGPQVSGSATVNYSDVQAGWGGTSNITADPCFVDAAIGDYHLLPGSPCIDAGDPFGDYSGQTDIDGEPRVFGNYVDMGIDEAWPDIDVSPLSYDFGDVGLGTSTTTIVTISNVGNRELTVSDIAIDSSDFSITPGLTLPVVVGPNGFTDVEITYAPAAEGYSSAVLEISSDDPDEPLVEVVLGGAGVVTELPPSEQIAEMIGFIDSSVDEGRLAGDGPGSSAGKRLNALQNMIEAAGDLIEDGWFEEACQQLMAAYKKTDGQPRPPDFVAGDAAAELASKIQDLMTNLGCEL